MFNFFLTIDFTLVQLHVGNQELEKAKIVSKEFELCMREASSSNTRYQKFSLGRALILKAECFAILGSSQRPKRYPAFLFRNLSPTPSQQISI